MYLMPAISEDPLHEVYVQHGVLIVIGLFAGMASTTLVVQIFRTGIDDGTDLIILVKPINKANILWVKFFVFLSYVIITSLLLTGESAFTILSAYNEYDFAYTIIIGSFVGTLVIMLLWGGLTIIFTVFYKKFGTFLFSISAQAIILIIAVVFSVVTVSPGSYLKDKKNIYYEPIAILSQPDSDGHSNYQWAYYSHLGSKSSPVTEDTKFNGMTLRQYGVDLSKFNQMIWDKAQTKTNRNVLNNIDLNNQLVSMFYLQTESYFKNHLTPNAIISRMDRTTGEGSFYNIKFGGNGARTIIENINPNIYENKLGQHPMLVSNSDYYVQPANYRREYFNNLTKNSLLEHNAGKFNFDFNFDSVVVPTANITKDNKIEINFEEVHSPEDMTQKMFSDEMFEAQSRFAKVVDENQLSPPVSIEGLNFALLNSMYVPQSNLYKDFEDFYNTYSDKLYLNYSRIQYWSYLMLKKYSDDPRQYPWFIKHHAYALYFTLNGYPLSEKILFQNDKPFLYASFDDMLKTINGQPLNYELANNWAVFRPQFGVVDANQLPTLAIATLTNVYDMNALIICWTTLGVILSVIGLALFMKRDFN